MSRRTPDARPGRLTHAGGRGEHERGQDDDQVIGDEQRPAELRSREDEEHGQHEPRRDDAGVPSVWPAATALAFEFRFRPAEVVDACACDIPHLNGRTQPFS